MRGRKPIPDKIKKLKGTFKPCRAAKVIDLMPLNGLPACPEYLNDTAKEIYLTQGPNLMRIKQLNENSLSVFVAYCLTAGKVFELEKELKKLKAGSYAKHNKEGLNMILSLERLSNNLVKNMRSLASELGVTPASYGRAYREAEKKESEFEQYIRKQN